MEVYNERWRIQECPSMKKSNILLRWLWCLWLNSLRSATFIAILVCVLPLVLPALVILSAFVVAFSIPMGFMFAVYTEISELKSSLLCEPRPPVSFCAVYEDVFSDGRKEEDKFDEEKLKEEGYEQDYDLEEDELESEDDLKRVIEDRIELGEEYNEKIQGKGEMGNKAICGQNYDVEKENKYDEEKIKEEGYKQDYDLEEEEKELDDDTRRASEARIELGEENYNKIQEEDDLGTEIGGQLSISKASDDFKEVIADHFEQNKDKDMKKYRKKTNGSEEKNIDIEQANEVDSFKFGMETEDRGSNMVEFDDAERESLRERKKRVIKDDDMQAEHENTVSSTRVESPFLSWGSSGSFGNIEQLLAPPDKENADKLQEDCGDPGEQFHNVEPGELVRETMHMVESVRNEGEVEIKDLQQSMEEATAILPAVSSTVNGAVLDLERVKLLSIEEDSSNDVHRLQTINEQLESKKEKSREDPLASIRLEIECTSSTTMKFIPQKVKQLNPGKYIGNVIETENHTVGMKGVKRDIEKL